MQCHAPLNHRLKFALLWSSVHPEYLNPSLFIRLHYSVLLFSQNYFWVPYWFNLISFPLTEFGNLLLLVASRNQIIVDNITSQSHSIYSLIRDGRNIVAIDFDSVTDRIFWSDTTQDKIWSAYKNGTDRKIVSSTELFLSLHCGEKMKTLYLHLTERENSNVLRREIT